MHDSKTKESAAQSLIHGLIVSLYFAKQKCTCDVVGYGRMCTQQDVLCTMHWQLEWLYWGWGYDTWDKKSCLDLVALFLFLMKVDGADESVLT